MITETFKAYERTHSCSERKDKRMMVRTLDNGCYFYWVIGRTQANDKNKKADR